MLFAFFSKEKATKKPIVSFDRVYQKTSKALGVSYTSVYRIMNGIKRPCKSNRPKERAKILDDFDHCVIKRTIHGLYSRKIAPTVSIIHKEIKISKSKLTLTLIDLGYTYKKNR
jgi:transposase